MSAAAKSAYPYTDFDQERVEHWLRLFEFEPGDGGLRDILQREVVAPNIESIVERFYEYLYSHDLYTAFLADSDLVQRLQASQMEYLRGFGLDYGSRDYFIRRLAIGVRHYRLGVPLSLFDCAYYKLGELIMAHAPRQVDDNRRRRLQRLLNKLLRLDMSLVTEGYTSAQIQSLEATIDGMRQKLTKLRRLASTDLLTSFANRDFAINQLKSALAAMHKHGNPPYLLMMDVDHFKQINDVYGHLTGDQVLHMVASRAKACTRDFDTVGRYGGDELMVVLRDASETVAQTIAERIRQSVCESAVRVHGNKIRITVSLGIARARAGDGVEALIGRADRALYDAKHRGRNRVMTRTDD